MAIRENKSNNLLYSAASYTFAPGGTNQTDAIDTANFDNGVTVFIMVAGGDDPANTASVTDVLESASATGPFTSVDPEKFIGELADLQGLTAVADSPRPTLGLFGTERYIEIAVEADAGNTGNVVFNVGAWLGGEVKPVGNT